MGLVHKETYRQYRIHIYERRHRTRSTGRRFTNYQVRFGQQYLDFEMLTAFTELDEALKVAKEAIDWEERKILGV